MQIAFDEQSDAVVARVMAERIDAASAEAFRTALAPALEGSAPRVVLDMSQVIFLDSTALGALVGMMKRLDRGRRLELTGVGPRLRRIFDLTGMDQMITIDGAGGRSG